MMSEENTQTLSVNSSANTALTLLGDEVLIDLAGPGDRRLFNFLLLILPLWVLIGTTVIQSAAWLSQPIITIIACLALLMYPITLLRLFNLKIGFMRGEINLPGIIPGSILCSNVKSINLGKTKPASGAHKYLEFTVQGDGDSLNKLTVDIDKLTIENAKLLWHCLAKNCRNSEIDVEVRQALTNWGSFEQDSFSKAYALLGIEPGKQSDRDLSIEINLSKLKMRNSVLDYLGSPFSAFIQSWVILWLTTFFVVFTGIEQSTLFKGILALLFALTSIFIGPSSVLSGVLFPTSLVSPLYCLYWGIGLIGTITVVIKSIIHQRKLNTAADQIFIDYMGITSRMKTKTGYLPTSYIQWKQLKRVAIEGENKAERSLVFHPDSALKSKITIPLFSLTDSQSLEKIFEALKVWAPENTVEPSIYSELEHNAGGSFTELWLSSLSSAPSLQSLTPLTQGARLEGRPYQIESLLGSGGQGVTYLMTSTESDKTYVLKEVILPSRAGYLIKEKILKDFENQCQLLAKVKHPQIVGLQESFVQDGRAYLLMDFIEGESLFDHISKNGPFSAEKAVSAAISLCEILEYLHGLKPPVIHRDFTPHNLILDKDGKLNLIDFGVALENSETSGLQKASIVGKQNYMPIEQLRGSVDQRCDIYALGGCIYFMLTGEEPEPLTDLSKVKSAANDLELLPILAGCTAQAVENRFHSAAQCREALVHWLRERTP
ncbi:MAG: serine/threonine protein kinase [Candidatus Obscuribacterales bacterium]|nr:serine/threonine protein kinase [Candidatus Obscuribacterales bacterium]